jgi:hypothetical protein
MMAFVRRTAILTIALTFATALVAWWMVPVVAGTWTFASPRRASVIGAALAGGLSWALMLLVASRAGPVFELADVLGQTLGGFPGNSLLLLTAAYSSLLAGSAALLAQALRPTASSRSTST